MDADRARVVLREQAEGPTGFVGSLRPFRGLVEANFHAVMEAVLALAPELSADLVERHVLHDLWLLSLYPRRWGLEPTGMLRRNALITDEDAQQLGRWVEILDRTVLALLGRVPVHLAFGSYVTYVIDRGDQDVSDALLTVLGDLLEDEQAHSQHDAVRAIARFGIRAKRLLPALRSALARQHHEPGESPESVTREIHGLIREAIQRIESDR